VVLCARSIKPLERGHPGCGGRGCYGNSMMGRSGCAFAKTSYTRKMNDLAQSSIRAFPLSFLP
jgi:hypothetical protein